MNTKIPSDVVGSPSERASVSWRKKPFCGLPLEACASVFWVITPRTKYWVLEAPDRAGLGFAFLVGLLADLAFGNLLGEQALRLVVMTFILQRFRARLRFFPLSQQAFAVGALLLNDRVLVAATHVLLGARWPTWLFWLSPAIGAVLWPVVYVGLDTLRLGRVRR